MLQGSVEKSTTQLPEFLLSLKTYFPIFPFESTSAFSFSFAFVTYFDINHIVYSISAYLYFSLNYYIEYFLITSYLTSYEEPLHNLASVLCILLLWTTCKLSSIS